MPSFEMRAAIKIKKLFAVKTLRAESARLGLKMFPTEKVDAELVLYERERVIRGIQAARGIGGPTSSVSLPPMDQFSVSPGYYGEHMRWGEEELLKRRVIGDWFESEGGKEFQAAGSSYLNERYLNRREKNNFDLLLTGGFQAMDKFGNIKYQAMYEIQQLSLTVPVTTYATAAPLAELRALVVQAQFGRSVDFRNGELWMNANTLNEILKNQNPNDLKGVRLNNGDTINSWKDKESGLQRILLANDLPPIMVYDENYYPDGTGSAIRFIADGRAILLGKRTDGQALGKYMLTRAVQNNEKPGEWFVVEDNRAMTRPYLQIAGGHNGCPVLEYPEAVAAITLY